MDLLRPVAWPALSVLAVYVLFALVLPALADITPPGVDPKLVAAAAAQEAVGVREGCADACKGMGCPTGWTTARSPDDVCKCICARVDPGAATPWDSQQKAKQEHTAVQQPSPPHEQALEEQQQRSQQEQPLQQLPRDQLDKQPSDASRAPEQQGGRDGGGSAGDGAGRDANAPASE